MLNFRSAEYDLPGTFSLLCMYILSTAVSGVVPLWSQFAHKLAQLFAAALHTPIGPGIGDAEESPTETAAVLAASLIRSLKPLSNSRDADPGTR